MTAQRILPFLSALFLFLGLTAASHATLIDRGGGLIYDDDLNVTWLQDANHAMTSGYDADGEMTWAAAMTWADGLSYAGYDDWRLPTTPGTEGGFVNEGEMGHLWYDEGVTYTSPSPFTNVQNYTYWSDTEVGYPSSMVWSFNFRDDPGVAGSQGQSNKNDGRLYAWAVRDGDVASVPEPASLLLLGSGLVGMIGLRKVRK